MNVSAIQPRIVVGDFMGNAQRLTALYQRAVAAGARLVVGPEDALAGYCVGDQRLYPGFMAKHDAALAALVSTIGEVPLVIGITERNHEAGRPFLNTAVFIHEGRIVHRQVKTNLAIDSVFSEHRWYEPNRGPIEVFTYQGARIAMLVCQDLWERYDTVHGTHRYRRAPVSEIAGQVDIVLVPNASPYYHGKGRARYEMVKEAVATLGAAVVYANYSGGHDELVFDGRSFIMNRQGAVVGACAPWKDNDIVTADLAGAPIAYPFGDGIDDLGTALITSLRDYVEKGGMKGVVLGLSGGIDSALCAALAVSALGRERVIGIRMPSQYSSQGSLDDAAELGRTLGIRVDTVPIAGLYRAYESELQGRIGFGVARDHADVTEENLQARIRGTIVMAYANKYGYMGIATGNKSEFAVGYATLYGDMAGGFALIKDVFKLDVYRLAAWVNERWGYIPERSITKPPSAELRPDQKDTDSLPPYGILDPILKAYIERSEGVEEIVAQGYERHTVEKVIAMTDRAEFKRRQAPPGPIVSAGGLAWLNRQYPMATSFRP